MSDVRHTEDQLRAIAAQLAHPDGEAGIAMGHTMNDSNTGMVLRTIAALEVQDGDRVLELGHGNCIHLESLLAGKSDVRYHGLEISGTMHRASVAANAQRTFMEKLPFTRFGFELYDDARFAALAEGSAFMAPSFIAEREMVTSKDGHRLLRTYAIATLVK